MQAIEFEAFASKHLKVKISMDEPCFEEQLEIGREFMREYADTFQALTIRCERKPTE